jgi:hypothetical protein
MYAWGYRRSIETIQPPQDPDVGEAVDAIERFRPIGIDLDCGEFLSALYDTPDWRQPQF